MILMFFTRMKKHVCIMTFMVAALRPASGACAAGPAVPDSVSTALQEVTVEGRRVSDEVGSSAPLHTIDAADLKVAAITGMADAVGRLPGVVLRDYGGAGGMKTVSVRGFGSGHTAVAYDGVPLSDAQSGSIDISRYSLDNVGALRLTVGDNSDILMPARLAASAATFSISTDSPFGRRDSRAALTTQLKAGSFGYISPFLKVEVPVGKVTLQASGEYVHAKNDYPFTLTNVSLKTRERRTNSMMNTGHGELNALWRIAARHSLAAKAYYYDSDRHLPGPVIYYNSESHERLRERSFFCQLRYRGSLGHGLSMLAIAKFNWSASLYHDENGKYPGGVLDQNYWQREAYVSGSLLYTPVWWASLDYAADYFYNNLNSNLATDSRPRRHSVLQSFTGKFTLGPVTLMARALWSIYLNSALQGTPSRDARRLSPSASVSWQPWSSADFHVRASYKNIFRMPSFSEAYFDHYGSVDLKPESTDQLNLGLTYGFDVASWLPQATITADGYLNHVKDMIVAVPYNMFVWSMTNLSKSRVFGLDLTADLRFRPAARHAVTFMGTYSFQRAEPRTSRSSSDWMKQVAYIPRNSGSFSLGWENPWVNVSFSASGIGHRFTTSENLPATRIAGFMEFGAGLWKVVSLGISSLELRANIINMFDRQYEIVANYPMPGRSFQFTVRYEL